MEYAAALFAKLRAARKWTSGQPVESMAATDPQVANIDIGQSSQAQSALLTRLPYDSRIIIYGLVLDDPVERNVLIRTEADGASPTQHNGLLYHEVIDGSVPFTEYNNVMMEVLKYPWTRLPSWDPSGCASSTGLLGLPLSCRML